MNSTEQEIIQKILNGDINAYKLLVDKYANQIMNLCYRYINSTDECEDATQEVFIKAFRALKKWEPRATFKTWIYRIAINHCLNHIRRQQKIGFLSILGIEDEDHTPYIARIASAEDNIESQMITDEKKRKIELAINRLPENQRHVIILYYFQKLSYTEIAEVLDCSLSSIESRLFRAKKSLAKMLGK